MTGTLGNVCSAWVQGDKVQVKLYTDDSVVRYGFDIVRIEAKKGPDILARFPGQWYERHTEVRDPNTNTLQHAGLHYNWHRYYDPNIGRYITPDPIGFAGGLHVYACADDDPVNLGGVGASVWEELEKT